MPLGRPIPSGFVLAPAAARGRPLKATFYEKPLIYSGGVILLTGATGTIGSELLPLLLSSGEQVRALVRDPRRLGAHRVNVQISLGDLSDPFSIRHAMRGVHTVIHLASSPLSPRPRSPPAPGITGPPCGGVSRCCPPGRSRERGRPATSRSGPR